MAEQRATWLLVYDNVPAPDAIADLLPPAGARVLITSRWSDWSELADEVALDVLPLEEAVAFLQSRTGRGYADAQTLAEVLGRLPLALDHAAAYCKRTQMRFADYAEKASSLLDAAPRGVGYLRSAAATFDLAITAAVAQCPAAEALMAYFARCAPERIPMALVEGAMEEEVERQQALAALAEVSLIKHDPFEDGSPAVTVHRLVQSVARARSETNGSGEEAVRRLIARLVAIYPQDSDAYSNPRSWPLCASLTPHLLARRGSDEASVSELLNRAGSYFHGRAAYSQAAPLLRVALAIRENALGPEHPGTTSLNNLAGLLRDQGDLAGARPLYERALAIREKRFARLLKDTGHANEAEPLFRKAIAIVQKALGADHSLTQRFASFYARLLLDTGRAAEAQTMAQSAVTIHEAASGPNHPWTRNSAQVTADALDALGRTEEAKALRERYGVTSSDDAQPS